jgi:hypothetical protein
MTNDYSYSIIAEQRRQEFAAEAAHDRLVRIATADRTPWWRRLANIHIRKSPLTTAHQTAH